MDSPSNTFLLQWLFAIWNPTLLQTIVGLSCHFILWNKNKARLNVIIWQLGHLFLQVVWPVLHQPFVICIHLRYKHFLSIFHHIRLLMAIIIQPFFVLNITKTFLMNKLSRSLNGDALYNFLMNLREEFNLQPPSIVSTHEASLLQQYFEGTYQLL